MIPDFSEFAKAMGPEAGKRWTSAIKAERVEIKSPEDFAAYAISSSQSVAFAMLKDYHEWLRKQLS